MAGVLLRTGNLEDRQVLRTQTSTGQEERTETHSPSQSSKGPAPGFGTSSSRAWRGCVPAVEPSSCGPLAGQLEELPISEPGRLLQQDSTLASSLTSLLFLQLLSGSPCPLLSLKREGLFWRAELCSQVELSVESPLLSSQPGQTPGICETELHFRKYAV